MSRAPLRWAARLQHGIIRGGEFGQYLHAVSSLANCRTPGPGCVSKLPARRRKRASAATRPSIFAWRPDRCAPRTMPRTSERSTKLRRAACVTAVLVNIFKTRSGKCSIGPNCSHPSSATACCDTCSRGRDRHHRDSECAAGPPVRASQRRRQMSGRRSSSRARRPPERDPAMVGGTPPCTVIRCFNRYLQGGAIRMTVSPTARWTSLAPRSASRSRRGGCSRRRRWPMARDCHFADAPLRHP